MILPKCKYSKSERNTDILPNLWESGTYLDLAKLEIFHRCICNSTAIALKTHWRWKLLMNSTVSSKLRSTYCSNMVCFPTSLQSLERCRCRFNEQCIPSVNVAFKSNWEKNSNTESARDGTSFKKNGPSIIGFSVYDCCKNKYPKMSRLHVYFATVKIFKSVLNLD